MPRMESIRVHNPSQSQSLHLNSISGDSPVFHAAFFKSKVSTHYTATGRVVDC